MVRHGGSSAGSYLADPTSPIPSHCASIVATSTLRVNTVFQILLHDQGEFPLLRDLGFAVAPGTHTLVGVERSEVHSMEPPYGSCNASDPSPMANCLRDCRTEMIVEKCGCRDIYMRNLSTGMRVCVLILLVCLFVC